MAPKQSLFFILFNYLCFAIVSKCAFSVDRSDFFPFQPGYTWEKHSDGRYIYQPAKKSNHPKDRFGLPLKCRSESFHSFLSSASSTGRIFHQAPELTSPFSSSFSNEAFTLSCKKTYFHDIMPHFKLTCESDPSTSFEDSKPLSSSSSLLLKKEKKKKNLFNQEKELRYTCELSKPMSSTLSVEDPLKKPSPPKSLIRTPAEQLHQQHGLSKHDKLPHPNLDDLIHNGHEHIDVSSFHSKGVPSPKYNLPTSSRYTPMDLEERMKALDAHSKEKIKVHSDLLSPPLEFPLHPDSILIPESLHDFKKGDFPLTDLLQPGSNLQSTTNANLFQNRYGSNSYFHQPAPSFSPPNPYSLPPLHVEQHHYIVAPKFKKPSMLSYPKPSGKPPKSNLPSPYNKPPKRTHSYSRINNNYRPRGKN